MSTAKKGSRRKVVATYRLDDGSSFYLSVDGGEAEALAPFLHFPYPARGGGYADESGELLDLYFTARRRRDQYCESVDDYGAIEHLEEASPKWIRARMAQIVRRLHQIEDESEGCYLHPKSYMGERWDKLNAELERHRKALPQVESRRARLAELDAEAEANGWKLPEAA